MWWIPGVGTIQATQAGLSCPAARARKDIWSPPVTGRGSSRALARRAGCAAAAAVSAGKVVRNRRNRGRRMASVLFRPVRTDRNRSIDRRETDDRRRGVAELDPAGVLVPVLAGLPAGLRSALEGGTAGALDADRRGVSLRKRE